VLYAAVAPPSRLTSEGTNGDTRRRRRRALYSVFRTGDQMLVESSKIAELKRPAEPLIIYEFEGCPFWCEAPCLPVYLLRSSSNMDALHVKGKPVLNSRKPTFPVRFGSFTCSQTRNVGSICLTRIVIVILGHKLS